MKENKYDDPAFFARYSQFPRSVEGLSAAGEWHELQNMLPDFHGKRVLDIGCGFGWHCLYAAEHGAARVTGIDLSAKMLAVAEQKKSSSVVDYQRMAMEDMEFTPGSFDVVLSSLVFHYTPDFDLICQKVAQIIDCGGVFVFSVEHPVFTAHTTQDWSYDASGNKQHWPVDAYFEEGPRTTTFLGEQVVKYHRTLTSTLNTLLRYGFSITRVIEPQPDQQLLESVPEMRDEARRPMMLLVSAVKAAPTPVGAEI